MDTGSRSELARVLRADSTVYVVNDQGKWP